MGDIKQTIEAILSADSSESIGNLGFFDADDAWHDLDVPKLKALAESHNRLLAAAKIVTKSPPSLGHDVFTPAFDELEAAVDGAEK